MRWAPSAALGAPEQRRSVVTESDEVFGGTGGSETAPGVFRLLNVTNATT